MFCKTIFCFTNIKLVLSILCIVYCLMYWRPHTWWPRFDSPLQEKNIWRLDAHFLITLLYFAVWTRRKVKRSHIIVRKTLHVSACIHKHTLTLYKDVQFKFLTDWTKYLVMLFTNNLTYIHSTLVAFVINKFKF